MPDDPTIPTDTHWDFDRDTPRPGSLWQDPRDQEWLRVYEARGNRVGESGTIFRFTGWTWYGDESDEPTDDEAEIQKRIFNRDPKSIPGFVPASFDQHGMPTSHWDHESDRPRPGSVWRAEGNSSDEGSIVVERATDDSDGGDGYVVHVRANTVGRMPYEFCYYKRPNAGIPSYEPRLRKPFVTTHWDYAREAPKRGSKWCSASGRLIVTIVSVDLASWMVACEDHKGDTVQLVYQRDPRGIPAWRPCLDRDVPTSDDGSDEDVGPDHTQGEEPDALVVYQDETLSELLARLAEVYDDA